MPISNSEKQRSMSGKHGQEGEKCNPWNFHDTVLHLW